MKIRYWIISIIILLAIFAYSFNYFYEIERKTKIEEIFGHQKIHARQASKSFSQLFEKWNNVLFYLSKDSDIILLNSIGKNDIIRLRNIHKDEIKAITRTDKNGIIIYTVPYLFSSIGANISQQEHMRKILKDHEPVVSDVFSAVQGFKAVVIHYPVYKNGKFDGTIAFLLNFEQITKGILDDIKIGKTGYAWMLSGEGIELYCPIPGHVGKSIHETAKGYPELLKLAGQMLSGKEGTASYAYYDKDNSDQVINKIAYFLPIRIKNTFWSLAITYSEDEITASLTQFRNKLIGILALLFFGGIFLSYFGLKAWIILKESELKKLTEKELLESEERYRTVIETTDTGYAVLTEKGIVIDANLKYAQLSGYKSINEIVNHSVIEWTAPKDKELHQHEIVKCLETGNVRTLELEYQHKDGTIIPVEINANTVHANNRLFIIKLCRDITERKRTEEALMKERTLLRTLIDNLPSGVFIKDKEHRNIIVNLIHADSIRGHLKHYGLDPDIGIIGKTDFEVFPTEQAEKFFEEDKKVILDGIPILNHVEPGIGPDGKMRWLLVSKVPFRDKKGRINGMVGITIDITDRKLAEEELVKAKEKAEESDRLKTAFLNNISHEIRTPLNAIVGFSGFLKEQDFADDKRDQFIDIIIQSSNQLLSIITDIINIATIEAGQLKINLDSTDINSNLQLLFEQHKNNAISKNIELKFSAGLVGKDAVVFTDRTKFIEVLSNLVTNAIKFTSQGSVTFGYELKENMLQFYVEDTGIGINPEFHSAIFDRFRQVESTLSNKYGGTGLGLSISKAYVECLGGKIWLTSQPGVGSKFYFTIPYNKA